MKGAENFVGKYFAGLFVVVSLCLAMAGAGYGSDYVPDELLAQPKAGVSDEQLNAIFKSHNVTVKDTIPQINVKVLKVSPHAIEQVKTALSKNPLFSSVENNFLAIGSSIPNDTYYSSQWHLPKISSPSGWDISTGASNVPIAIIDSGVDPAHPDLSAKLLPGYNYLDNTTNTADVLGHGTSVAGSAAALSNNTTGVAGVAWNNPIMPLVVLNSSNFASYLNIAKAITYAADQGVRVVNISIGGTSSSSTLQNAVDYAWNKGTAIFASAGNSSSSALNYPAACNNVVAVSATTSSDTIASFSTYGNWIEISAPGSSIYTTANGGGYRSASGTSFSSPIAAGLAALVLSVNPSLTNAQVVTIMEENADDLGSAGFDIYYGYGRINAYKSLTAAKNTNAQKDTISPTVSITSPTYNATVSNIASVSVSATDNAGVSRVELYIGGTLFATDTTEPFDFSWDTTQYPDGSYALEARAYDSSGNMGTSDTILVSVYNPKDTSAPFVSILYPINGATVNGMTAISASATDDIGVSKVELYIGGTLFASDTTEPFEISWDTTQYPDGSYALEARAYDSSGNVGTSNPVQVTVSNPKETTPPVVTITSPANNAYVTNSQKINVTATDNVSVSSMELYIDNALKSTVTGQTTLSYTWNTRKVTSGAHNITAKAYDAAGNMNINSITVYK